MKFYFCETCGKRVTEKDIEAGRARNKQLKGIFCEGCAEGVMTLEMQAISTDDLRKIIDKQSGVPSAPQSSSPPLRMTPAAGNTVRTGTASAKPSTHSAAHAPAPESGMKLMGLAVLAGIALAVMLVVILRSGPAQRPAPRKEEPVVVAPVEPPRPVEPVKPAPPIPTPPPVKPADPKPVDPAIAPVSDPRTPISIKPGETVATLTPDPAPVTPPPADTAVATPPASNATATATPPVPPVVDTTIAIEQILQQSIDLLTQSAIPAALKATEKNSSVPADAKAALVAALESLQKREQAWYEGLKKRTGEKVKIETRSGVVEGTVLAVEDLALKIDKPLVFDGAVKGSVKVPVLFSNILPASREALVPLPALKTAGEWTGAALLSLAKHDFDAASAALAQCEGQPLTAALKNLEATGRTHARNFNAQAAWKDIETQMAAKPSQSQAKTVLAAITKLETEYQDTLFLKDAALLQRIATAKEEMSRLILGLDPRIPKLFKGKVTAYEPRTQRITVAWDMTAAGVKDDFEGSLNDVNALDFRASGVWLYNCRGRGAFIQLPQFVGDGATVKFTYKDLRKIDAGSLGVAFFCEHSKTDNPQPMAVVSGGTEGCGVWDSLTADGAWLFKTKLPDSEPLPKDGVFEASMDGRRIVVKSDSKVIYECAVTKPNDHAGLGIGGGRDTTLMVTRIEVTARLDPKWIARKLDTLQTRK
jgi:hypothetical protein